MVYVAIERHAEPTAPEIQRLVDAAEAEGHVFVARTVDEWATGANRFDGPNEAFFLASVDGEIVGMCGVNVDPYVDDPTVGRLRHLYVHPSNRSARIGEQLTDVCLSHAWGRFDTVRLRTPGEAADRFYERIGFRRISSDTATHERSPYPKVREFCLRSAEIVGELRKYPFEPGLWPPCLGPATGLGRSLVSLASKEADNFRIDDAIDGGGVQYWENIAGQLVVYSTHSLGFADGRDIVSKTVFDDRGDHMEATLFVGNLDHTIGMAAEYSGAVLLHNEGDVLLTGKRLEPIEWTRVLRVAISLDDAITVV